MFLTHLHILRDNLGIRRETEARETNLVDQNNLTFSVLIPELQAI